MRTKIRRNRDLTYNEQMYAAQTDAETSRRHPNGIANRAAQIEDAALNRALVASLKLVSRKARSERRREKKERLAALGYSRKMRRSFTAPEVLL